MPRGVGCICEALAAKFYPERFHGAPRRRPVEKPGAGVDQPAHLVMAVSCAVHGQAEIHIGLRQTPGAGARQDVASERRAAAPDREDEGDARRRGNLHGKAGERIERNEQRALRHLVLPQISKGRRREIDTRRYLDKKCRARVVVEAV
jgi:hypothetical protein